MEDKETPEAKTKSTYKSILDHPGIDDRFVAYGDTIKMTDGGKIEGYLVRFGSPSDVDLEGDFFTADTDFGINIADKKSIGLYFHHGFDSMIKTARIGEATIKQDEIGLWLEGQLQASDAFRAMLGDNAEKMMGAIKTLASMGRLGLSSGAVGHLVDGKMFGNSFNIQQWVIGESSATVTPAEPRNIVSTKSVEHIDLLSTIKAKQEQDDQKTMNEDLTKQLTDAISGLTSSVESMEGKLADLATKSGETVAETVPVKEPVKESKIELEAPAVIPDTSHWKYDSLSAGELSMSLGILGGGVDTPVSDSAYKALAIRLASDSESKKYVHARTHMNYMLKSRGIKANEIMQSTLASGGDEWVTSAGSQELWEQVRVATWLLGKIPTTPFPEKAESWVLPIESTDPTWYKVAQASALSANPGGIPTNTVTSSKVTTGKVTMTLSKLGARVLFTGEFNEDSLIQVAPQLMRQIVTSGSEYLESAFIDGDTASGGSANINDIAGTPASTDWFMIWNGFRKSCLVTTTANSRDGGTLGVSDFIETAKLMGNAGVNALDTTKVGFIIDPLTNYAAVQLPEVKTRDINSQATVESGKLSSIYGYDVRVSGQIHKASATRQANTAGKVDVDTTSNNTTGSLLAVRYDQWLFAPRRDVTFETTRIPSADATEIVAMMRGGFIQRDTEASAISYNIT